MVDALASGASIRKDVKVQVLSWAPLLFKGRMAYLLSINFYSPYSDGIQPTGATSKFFTRGLTHGMPSVHTI